MSKGLDYRNTPLDCSMLTQVDGIAISGTQPSGSDRRLVFKLPGATQGVRTYPITTNAVATDTVTICGVTFTAIANGATGNQFNVGVSTTATATNLAAVLNANATISALYTATAVTGTITLTEKIAGGNTPTTATKTGTIVIGTGTVTTSVASWFKLTGSGSVTLTPVATQTITVDSVLAEGNTVAEVLAATSIPGFAGKSPTPAIALSSPAGATDMPTLRFDGVVGKSSQPVYVHTEETTPINLGQNGGTGCITDFTLTTTATGGCSVTVEASLLQNDTWGNYISLEAAKNVSATAVKIKTVYTATTIGTGSAKIDRLIIVTKTDDSYVVGTTAAIYLATQNFEQGMLYGRVLVKHEELIDSRIKAYIHFGETTKTRKNYVFATGTGAAQTVNLSDIGIEYNSIKLYADLSPLFDFDFNTATNQLTFTAPANSSISGDWTYGETEENWQEMQKGTTQLYQEDGLYSTDFSYSVTAGTAKGISAIKIETEKPSGSVTNQQFGVATGRMQYFVLDHYARKDTISITASDVLLPADQWNYDQATKTLSVVATKNAPLKYSFVYDAEVPVVRGIIACWNQ